MSTLYQARAWENLSKQMKTLAKEDEKYAEIQKLMWEISEKEFKKPDTAEEVVDVLTRYVNSSITNEEEFVFGLTRQTHKTLQQGTFRLFLKCVKSWAEMDKDENYDARNQATVKQSTLIQEALKNEHVPFI